MLAVVVIAAAAAACHWLTGWFVFIWFLFSWLKEMKKDMTQSESDTLLCSVMYLRACLLTPQPNCLCLTPPVCRCYFFVC